MKLPSLRNRSRPAEPEDPIVYLATVGNEPLARMWAEVLEDEGIRAMVKPLGPGMGAWASAATFEHELYVLRSHLARAQAIVRQIEADDAPADAVPPPPK